MPLIKSLAHACIKSSDLGKTTAFYCDALGMKKLFDFTREGSVIGFYLKASQDAFIEVFHQDEITPGGHNRPLHHFCLECDDLKPVRTALMERGYGPGEIKMGADSSWQFWVKDPSGVDVEFHQYTEASSQRTGRSVEVDW